MTIQELYYARKYLTEKVNESDNSLKLRYQEALKAVEELIEMAIRYNFKNVDF